MLPFPIEQRTTPLKSKVTSILVERFSITNPQQLLPLPDVAFEADASGNLESRDHASLDLLSVLLASTSWRQQSMLSARIQW